MTMTSKERLLTAWSFREPDRVPVELNISEPARQFPEAERVVRFIDEEADNFYGAPGADWGFLGLPATYEEEVVEDVPGDFLRKRRVFHTEAGDFWALTRHKYEELNATDFHWERRYIHTLEEMERLADAPRSAAPVNPGGFREKVAERGERGLPLVGLLHPLGRLVRQATHEQVYAWLAGDPAVMHRFLESANQQLADTVKALCEAGIGPHFGVTAHEMLIPPWMSPHMFDEFVFPYDKRVNDAVHAGGGRLRAHCHDKVSDILEKLADMGVDALEPVEPAPYGDVDLADAKRRVGQRMMLSGNVPSQEFPTAEPAQVRQWVKEAVEAGKPGGGFSLRTTGGGASTNAAKDAEQMRVILRCIEAYIDAGSELGEY